MNTREKIRKQDVTMHIRMYVEELEQARRAAKKSRQTLSEMVRQLLKAEARRVGA